jgi:hypothetical protein
LRRSIADVSQAVNVAATVACLMFGGRVQGHPEYAPSTVNHYVKLDLVASDTVRLAYTVMVGPGPAAAWRSAADANGDGRVDDAEARTIGERARKAVAAFALAVDGLTVTPKFDAPVVGLAGDAVGPSPLSIDLVTQLALTPAARHMLRFEDRADEPQLGETEVLVEESPRTHLIASHRGATGSERETRFLFRGPKFSVLEDRSVTVVFEGREEHRQVGSAPGPRKSLYLLLLVPLVIVGAIGIRKGRRSTAARP